MSRRESFVDGSARLQWCSVITSFYRCALSDSFWIYRRYINKYPSIYVVARARIAAAWLSLLLAIGYLRWARWEGTSVVQGVSVQGYMSPSYWGSVLCLMHASLPLNGTSIDSVVLQGTAVAVPCWGRTSPTFRHTLNSLLLIDSQKKIVNLMPPDVRFLRLKCTKFDFRWSSASDP